MTQVKEWSNPELNRALAELMGYTESGQFYLNSEGEIAHVVVTWHPASDPAASLEVQTAAMKANPALYCDTLDRLVNPKFCEGKGEYWHETEVYGLIDVRPRERAEAAYITLSSKQ